MIRKDELIIDSFAGGGGVSIGIKEATGRSPDIAVNHDELALHMHEKNHPETYHVHDDVWSVDMEKLVGNRKVGLLHGSPDCFVAGTLVLTRTGLVPIEDVQVGEEVYTHRARWREVLDTVKKERASVVSVCGPGNSGLKMTPDHKIWCPMLQCGGGNMLYPARDRWRSSGELQHKGGWHAWATPRRFCPSDFSIPLPPVQLSNDFWLLIGRFLACGSFSKGDAVISCGYHDEAEFGSWLRGLDLKYSDGSSINFRRRELPDTVQYAVGSQSLVDWLLDQFGRLSGDRRIPTWCLAMQADWRRSLLQGYCDGNGHFHKPGSKESSRQRSATSVSKRLALGIKLLVETLGESCGFYWLPPRDSEIDGRPLKANESWKVRWTPNNKKRTYKDSTNFRHTKIRSVKDAGKATVYCLHVEEDHSFVADGIVVHNCTFFSVARGSKPVKKNVRSLAWVLVRWAKQLRPRIITLENVKEFEDWGPTTAQVVCKRCEWKGGRSLSVLRNRRDTCPSCGSVKLKDTGQQLPDPTKKGITFNRWVGYLRALGYHVQWRILNAADYGAPTSRKRLFVVARSDGRDIVWPRPTHFPRSKAKPSQKTWAPAADCIDWTIPCPSIFDREKPLVERTMRRIAMGVKRYVLDSQSPFIIRAAYGSEHFRGQDAQEPIATITGSNTHALVEPFMVPLTHSGRRRCHPQDEPMPTITCANRGEFSVCYPHIEKLSAFIVKHYTGVVGKELKEPLPTTTVRACQNQLLTASLVRHFGESVGQSLDEPSPTATACNKTGLLAASLVHANHGDKQWSDAEEPMRTITTNNHANLVAAFLVKFFGTAVAQNIQEPTGTLTTKDRYALVTVEIAGELYVMVDIGMRMLTPRELARCQGFPNDYWLPPTKTHAIAKIGNSVPPPVIAALLRANLKQRRRREVQILGG